MRRIMLKSMLKNKKTITKLDIAKNLIKEVGLSMDQVFKVLEIRKDQQDFFVSQLQKKA